MSVDELLTWHNGPPYDFHDVDAEPLDEAKTHVVRGDDGRAAAFWYFGLRPDLVGRGLGERFLRDELDDARERFHPHTFRLYVTEWNARAIALYARLGFREVGERHVRSFDRFGDHVFLRMERAA